MSFILITFFIISFLIVNIFSCDAGKFPLPNTSECHDPADQVDGFYFDTIDNLWKKCVDGCSKCSSTIDCITCKDSNYILHTDNKCYLKTQPPDLYFYKTGTSFSSCYQDCQTCSGDGTIDDQNCTKCPSDKSLIGTNCYPINSPPLGYTWDNLEKIFIYNTCYDSCNKCLGPGDQTNHNCLSCKESYYIKLNSKNCYNETPIGYFFNNERFIQCNSSCNSCESDTSCLTCAAGKVKSPINFLCIDSCPDNYYGINSICYPCNYPCKNCNNDSQCSSCLPNFNLINGKCVKQCNSNEFINEYGLCIVCPDGCEKCENPFSCNSCKEGFNLFNQRCYLKCPDGTFSVNNVCKNCSSMCDICTEDKYCIKCNEYAILQSQIISGIEKSTCVPFCPVNTFTTVNGCKNCIDSGRVLLGTRCADNCTTNTYADRGVCKPCKTSGKFIYDNECMNSCPNDYIWGFNQVCFPNNENNKSIINKVSNDIMILSCSPSPCRNGGKCIKQEGYFICKCPIKYTGKRCENLLDREQLKRDYEIYNNKPEKLSYNGLNELNNLVDQLTQPLSNDKEIGLDDNILYIIDTAIYNNIYKYLIIKNDDDMQNNYFDLYTKNKISLNLYIDTIIKTKDFQSNLIKNRSVNILLKTFNIHIFTSFPNIQDNTYTRNSLIYYKDCESKIRSDNQIPDSSPIIVKKMEYNNLDMVKNHLIVSNYSVSIEFYNSNGVKLEYQSCINQNNIIYSIPILTNSLNLDKYQNLIKQDFDIYNINSKPYQSRCNHIIDYKYDADTSINYRRSKYFENKIAYCSKGCTYLGLDSSNYLKCSCDESEIEVFYYFREYTFEKLRYVNLDVVMCPEIAFHIPEIHLNPGFYVGISSMGLFIFLVFVTCIMRGCWIGNDLYGLIYSDYRGFTNEDYFSRKVEKKLIDNKILDIGDGYVDNEKVSGSNLVEELYFEKTPFGGLVLKERIVSKTTKRATNEDADYKTENGFHDVNEKANIIYDIPKITISDISAFGHTRSYIKNYDQRAIFEFIKDYYIHCHQFFSIFLKTSLLYPVWLRINYFLLFINILFCLNALLFFDQDIDKRVNIPIEIRDNFTYPLVYETMRVIVSLVLAWTIMLVIRITFYKKYDQILNKALESCRIDKISIAYSDLNKRKNCSYFILIVMSFIIHGWCLYYMICWCGVYKKAALGWVFGGLWGVILHFCQVTIIIPLLLIMIRLLMRCGFGIFDIFLNILLI